MDPFSNRHEIMDVVRRTEDEPFSIRLYSSLDDTRAERETHAFNERVSFVSCL